MLKELRDFIAFLGTLWGLLAGASALFPLSGLFFETIPLNAFESGGVFDLLPPRLIVAVATTVSLFLILSGFVRRRTLAGLGEERLVGLAHRALWLGIGALILYMTLYSLDAEYAWVPLGMGTDDPRKLLFEVPLLLCYAAFFAGLTQAFTRLALTEYCRRN